MKSVRIRSYFDQHFPLIRTEHGEIRSIQSECGKMRTRITPNANIFYAVEDNKWMIHPSPRNATKLFVSNHEKSDMRMIYHPSLRGTTNVATVANESKEMVFHICKPFETRSILWKYCIIFFLCFIPSTGVTRRLIIIIIKNHSMVSCYEMFFIMVADWRPW